MQFLPRDCQATVSRGAVFGLGGLVIRNRLGVGLLAIFFCFVLGGCLPASGASRFAAEMVQPGKSITWPDGRVIRVERRAGLKLEGVRLDQGSKRVEAARGVISLDPDGCSFHVTLFGAAVSQDGRPAGSINEMSVLCRK